MDVYIELFGEDNRKLSVYNTNFGVIIPTLSARGISSVVVEDEYTWLGFVTHPQMREYTCHNMKVENGVASFTMYGVTFSHKGESK